MKSRLFVAALMIGLAPALEAQVKPVPPTPPAYPLPPIPPSIGSDMGVAIKHMRPAEILMEKEMAEMQALPKSLEAVDSYETSRYEMSKAIATVGGYDFEQKIEQCGTRTPCPAPDSLWAAGRAALNNKGFTQAVSLFGRLWRQHPRSAYAGDALYWEAFARRRLGSTSNLRTALERLDKQARDYKDAATRSDAALLATQIRGDLAQRGDARAAEIIAAQAVEAAGLPPAAPVAAVPPVPGQAPQAPVPPRAVTRVSPRTVRAGQRNTPIAGCPSEDDDERVAALNALQQMDSDLAMPILAKVLAKREKCSETLRRKAVFLVSQQKSAESADLLLQAAKTDPDREVKQNAVFWLGQVRDERAVTILGELLRSSDDYELQERAIFALSQHKSESAGAALRAYVQLESAPVDLRGKAIFWLAQQRSGENGPFLRDLYGKLQDEGLKEQVFQGLSQMRDQANAAWLLGIAQSPNEPMKMRTKALFWAAQSKEVPLSDFTALYDKVTDPEMKEQLIFAYAQRKEPAAVDKLMDIARKDASKELRGKAIFWLSQTKDPRVAKFLEELIIQ